MVLGIDAKGLDVFFILVDGYSMLSGANINTSGMGIDNGQGCGLLFHLDD